MALPNFGIVIEASTDAAKKGIAGLGDAIDSLKSKAKNAGSSIGAGLSDAFNEINNVNAGDAFGFMAMQDAADQLQGIGGQIQGLAGDYLDEAGQLAGEFDDVFNQIAQKTGAADDELQAMRDRALELGSTTQHSASGVAAVMKDLGADGFGVDEVLEGTDKVLNLATAGEMSAEEAGLALSDIFAGFKPNLDPLMSTGEAFTFLSDQMAMASDSTSLNVDQVAKTFLKFGPVAADAGIAFNDASALVGAISPVAKAQEAGTALKSIITSTRVAANDSTAEMWAEMGYQYENFQDANGQTDFLGILDFFRRAEMSTAQVVGMFGKEFLPVANMLLSDEGFASAAELMESQMMAAGKTAEIAGVNMEGSAGAAASLDSAIESLKIKLGSAGLTDFMIGLDGLKTSAVQFVSNLPTPILTTIVGVLGLVTAIGGLIAATGTGLASASAIGLLLPKIEKGLKILRAQAITPLILSVKTFFLTTLPSALAMLPATIAGFLPVIIPVLVGIALLATAALLIYKYWKPIKAFFDGFAEGFMFQWGIMKATISEAFTAALEPLKELQPAFAQIKQTLADMGFSMFQEQLDVTGNRAKSVGQMIGEAFGFAVGVIGSSIAGAIKIVGGFIRFGIALGEGFYGLYEFISGVFGQMSFYFNVAKDEFKVMITAVGSWVTLITSGFQLAGQTISTALGDAWAAISSYGTFVREGFQLLLSRLSAWVADLYSLYVAPYVGPIIWGIKAYYEGFLDMFAALQSGINLARATIDRGFAQAGILIGAIGSSLTQLQAEIGYRITAVRTVIGAAFGYVGSMFTLLQAEIGYRFAQVRQFLGGLFSTILTAFNSYIIQPYLAYLGWVWGGVLGAMQGVWGIASGMLSAIGGFLSEQFSGLMEIVNGLFNDMLRGTQEMWAIVTDTFSPAVEMFRSFIDMISTKFGQLAQAAQRLNPFGRGGGTTQTLENRNNATNQATAAAELGTIAGDTASGTIDTATAANTTAASVATTTTSSANNSRNVQIGNMTVETQAADAETLHRELSEINDRELAVEMAM